MLSKQQVIAVMPKQCRNQITDAAVAEINQALSGEPELQEHYRDNILGYIDVLKDGKFKVDSYLNAVRYVTFKLMGNSNVVSYAKTFPIRYQRLIDQESSNKDIAAYAAAYNKTKLVNLIYAQTLVPTHVLNADIHQKAINTQAELMISARSEKVRCDAANSLLTHLKQPEHSKIELDVSQRTADSLDDLREITAQLAKSQKLAIEQGTTDARVVAESTLVKTVHSVDDGANVEN